MHLIHKPQIKSIREEIYRAQTLAALQALERKYGYKFGWANAIHKARKEKHDRADRSRESGGKVVQAQQNTHPQDERYGTGRLAGQADSVAGYTVLDRIQAQR